MPEIAAAPEILGAGAGAGAEGAGGLPELPGMLKDFNDNPVSKITHAFMGAIGTQGDRERANIGPIGSIA